jgi:hypothetical protein
MAAPHFSVFIFFYNQIPLLTPAERERKLKTSSLKIALSIFFSRLCPKWLRLTLLYRRHYSIHSSRLLLLPHITLGNLFPFFCSFGHVGHVPAELCYLHVACLDANFTGNHPGQKSPLCYLNCCDWLISYE